MDDIYSAAEQLILPSVRANGDSNSSDPSGGGASGYAYEMLNTIHHQPLEEVEVEDFWRAVPDMVWIFLWTNPAVDPMSYTTGSHLIVLFQSSPPDHSVEITLPCYQREKNMLLLFHF